MSSIACNSISAPRAVHRRWLAVCFATVALARAVAAQAGAGAEEERYARVLQLTGALAGGQWAARPFTDRELGARRPAKPHPWAAGVASAGDSARRRVIAPSVSVRANSSAPQGFNDGPVWAGKGVTLAARGGVAARGAHWAVAAEPVAFVAQNARFALQPNGRPGPEAFGDWVSPGQIDLPQRFGDGIYARVDPGESYASLSGKGLTAGVSTAAEIWGPAIEFPLILGNNAAGIPRLFAGTSAPVRLPFVSIHGRIIWGQTRQSGFGSAADDRGFATGLVGSMLVRDLDLELGATRFAHSTWPAGGLADLPYLRLFQGILASTISGLDRDPSGADNQLASAFFRWAPNGGGVEIYGEYGREDRSYDFRDLVQEPDHAAAFVIGGQRAWQSPSADQVTVLRAEIMNSRISHLQQAASQYTWYSHASVLQGHTHQGQALGSVGAHGGGASTLAVDRYRAGGRMTVRWDRIMMAEFRNPSGLPVAGRADVIHSLGVERTSFGPRGRMGGGLTVAREFNRYFAGDAWNLGASLSYRIGQ